MVYSYKFRPLNGSGRVPMFGRTFSELAREVTEEYDATLDFDEEDEDGHRTVFDQDGLTVGWIECVD